MTFLDTSGILALAIENDSFHFEALKMMQAADDANEKILIHNYVLVEAAALLQSRISKDAATSFMESAAFFNIAWVDSNLHLQAVEYLKKHATSKISFVDVTSFIVMRSQGINSFIGFDKHFIEAGFVQYGSKNF